MCIPGIIIPMYNCRWSPSITVIQKGEGVLKATESMIMATVNYWRVIDC